jgi:hypothetical protein
MKKPNRRQDVLTAAAGATMGAIAGISGALAINHVTDEPDKSRAAPVSTEFGQYLLPVNHPALRGVVPPIEAVSSTNPTTTPTSEAAASPEPAVTTPTRPNRPIRAPRVTTPAMPTVTIDTAADIARDIIDPTTTTTSIPHTTETATTTTTTLPKVEETTTTTTTSTTTTLPSTTTTTTPEELPEPGTPESRARDALLDPANPNRYYLDGEVVVNSLFDDDNFTLELAVDPLLYFDEPSDSLVLVYHDTDQPDEMNIWAIPDRGWGVVAYDTDTENGAQVLPLESGAIDINQDGFVIPGGHQAGSVRSILNPGEDDFPTDYFEFNVDSNGVPGLVQYSAGASYHA